jgi:hypothetical protein
MRAPGSSSPVRIAVRSRRSAQSARVVAAMSIGSHRIYRVPLMVGPRVEEPS